jgi:hypothetical protein
MVVSDYQINSVIKTYVRNMKSKMVQADKTPESIVEDRVLVSNDGVRRMLFERIGERMTERLRKHDQEE